MGEREGGGGGQGVGGVWQVAKRWGGTQCGVWEWQWDLLPGFCHGALVLIQHSVVCWGC